MCSCHRRGAAHLCSPPASVLNTPSRSRLARTASRIAYSSEPVKDNNSSYLQQFVAALEAAAFNAEGEVLVVKLASPVHSTSNEAVDVTGSLKAMGQMQ